MSVPSSRNFFLAARNTLHGSKPKRGSRATGFIGVTQGLDAP